MAPKLGLDPGQPYEYDDEQTYEEAVAASIEAQYEPVAPAPAPVQQPQGDIGITEYDQGPSIETYAPEDYSYSPPPADVYFDETPAEPTTGMGFTDMGPVVQPYTPGSAYFDLPSTEPDTSGVISSEDWFTVDNQQRLFEEGLPGAVGPEPVLGEGSGLTGGASNRWFTDPEMQKGWWESEVAKAVQRGDFDAYQRLMAEIGQAAWAYEAYNALNFGYNNRFGEYAKQFNANLDAALSFDPSGEGGFTRTEKGNLISNLDLQGYMDQVGTPTEIINPFTNQPQSLTDWQREYEVRNALYQQDAEQGGPANFPVQMLPGQTFEQYVAERQRTFSGDPDAQAWFGGFGAGAYGAAPELPIPFDIASRIIDSPVGRLGSSIGQQVGNAGLTAAGFALGNVWDGTKWVATRDLPNTDVSLVDATMATLQKVEDASWGQLKFDVARIVRDARDQYNLSMSDLGDPRQALGQVILTDLGNIFGGDIEFSRVTEEDNRNLEAMVARWEERHPYLNLAGAVVYDPLNLPGIGALIKLPLTGTRNFAKLKTAGVLLEDALTADEMVQLAERGFTVKDLWRLGRAETTVNSILLKAGKPTLPYDRLAQAFSRRVIYRAHAEGIGRGDDITRIIAEERAGLGTLAERMGASAADVERLDGVIAYSERKLAEGIVIGRDPLSYPALGPGQVVSQTNEITPVLQPIEDTGRAIERQSDEVVSARSVEDAFIGPMPPAPSTRQKELAQAIFDKHGADVLPVSTLNRILNDEINGLEAYDLIAGAKATRTTPQMELASKLWDEGKLGTEEFAAIVNNKMSRDKARVLLDKARHRNPEDLRESGLVRVPENHPAYKSAVDAAWAEKNWRDISYRYLDDTLPRLETAPNKRARSEGFGRMAQVDVGRATRSKAVGNAPVAPPLLIVNALRAARNAGKLVGTKWETLIGPYLDDIAGFPAKNGGISSTTVSWLYKTLRDDILDAVRHGDTSLDDVKLLNNIIKDAYSGSKADDAAEAAAAARRLQNAPGGAEKVAKDIASWKQANEVLRPQIDAAKAAGDMETAKRLQRNMASNTGRIRKFEPDYQSPRPGKTPQQKVQETDEKLKAAGIEQPPSSDPTNGFVAPKDDATNDILARILDGADEQSRKSILRETAGMNAEELAFYEQTGYRSLADANRDAMQGAGRGWNLKFKTVEDVENAIGELNGKMNALERRGKKVPKWMHDRLTWLDDRAHFWRQNGWDGHDRIVHPFFTHGMRKIVDPMAEAWQKVDWSDAAFGKAFDAEIRRIYEPDSGWRKWASNAFSWGELQKGAKTAKTGDLGTLVVNQMLDAWNTIDGAKGEPMEYVIERLLQISDPKTTPEILAEIDPFFVNSREGGEMVRAFRHKTDDGTTIGQELVNMIRSGEVDPSPNIGWFKKVFGFNAKDGYYDAEALEKIDKMLSLTRQPARMSPSDWQQLQDLKAVIGKPWEDVRARHYDRKLQSWVPTDRASEMQVTELGRLADEADAAVDAAKQRHLDLKNQSKPDRKAVSTAWREVERAQAAAKEARKNIAVARGGVRESKRGVRVNELSDLLFPERVGKPEDFGKMADRIGTELSDLYATKVLKFDPSKVDPFMWLMQTVKGNLSALWMTMVPGYHVRNITGNLSAQMVAALRSDMHVSPSLRQNDLWKRVVAEERGVAHPWLRESLVSGTTADVAQGVTRTARYSKARFPVAALLDATPGVSQYKGFMEKVADNTENFSKKLIYSHEWGYSYADLWNKRLMGIDLQDAERTELVGLATFSELQKALDDLNITGAKRQQIIAANKEAKSFANIKAYKTASEALRDYRMRNRLDFVLDRMIPVHYWTTRNAMFVGRSLVNRPQTMAQAMGAYNAWDEQNKDLPPSMRWGLLPIPGNLLSWMPGVGVNPDDTFYLRAGTFINPAVFAIPKLLDPAKWDLSKTSLPDRLDAYGAVGLKNMWEAMGYQVGPQFDLILDQIAARSGNESLAGLAGWLANPSGYYNELERRDITDPKLERGYKAWLSRFGSFGPDGAPIWGSFGLASDSNVVPFVRFASGGHVNLAPAVEWINQKIYGSPYTRYETSKIITGAADLWQQDAISPGQFDAILWAVDQGNFDPTEEDATEFLRLTQREKDLSTKDVMEAFARIRPLVNGVTDEQAAGYLMNALGFGGKVDTSNAKVRREKNEQYWTISNLSDFLQSAEADEQYGKLVRESGWPIANAWLEENAPWLPGYWVANDDHDAVQRYLQRGRGDAVSEQADAAAVALYTERADLRTAQTPYYIDLDKAKDARDRAYALAGDNMIARDIADRIFDDAQAAIYDRAAANNVSMTGLDRLPRHSVDYYKGVPLTEARFLEQNMAPEDVEERRLVQEQRGHILDLVAEQLDIERYVINEFGQRVENKRFVRNGEWDEDAYQAALADAAEKAPELYRDLAWRYRDMEKMGFDSGIQVGALLPVSTEDFRFHMGSKDPELAAWREAKSEAWGAIQKMPEGTPEEKAAVWDAKQAFFNEWGEFPVGRDEVRGPSGFKYGTTNPDEGPVLPGTTALENANYGEKASAVSDWYWNQLTPRQQAELKEQYPDAFAEVEKTNRRGEKYTGTDFDPKRLTGDQLSRIIYSYDVAMPGVEEEFIVGRGGSAETPEQPGQQAANEARVEHVRMLSDHYKDNVLTDEEQATIDFKFATLNDPRIQEMLDYAEAHPTKKGKPGYYNARDAGYGDAVDAFFAALDGAKDAEQKQIDWFASLSADEQQLLATEAPSTFKWVAGKVGLSTGGSSESSDTTASTSVASTESGGQSGGSSTTGTRWTGSSGSGWSSSRSSGSSRSSSFGTGGGNNRSGEVGQPSADEFVGILTTLDPFLAGGNDDGRGEIVSQIGTRLAALYGPILLMMQPKQRNLIQSLLLRWITASLGTNPTIESWQKILAFLSKNDQPQTEQPVQATEPEQAAITRNDTG